MTDHRAQMVQLLRERGAIRTVAVATAFAEVPRELFIPEVAADGGLETVYRDEAFVTKKDPQGAPLSSSSQPAMMAAMLELLEVEAGQRVLEIGAGTGYNAALLAHLVGPGGHVTTIDVDPEIAARARRALYQAGANAEIAAADGRLGFATGAPYDRIIVTACARELPAVWLRQLVEGGRLVVPIRLAPDADAFDLIPAFVRRAGSLRAIDSTWGGFMALHGGDGVGRGARPRLDAALSCGQPLVSVSGAVIERLSATAAKRLLSMLLGPPPWSRAGRAIAVGSGEPPGILVHLTTRIPASRRIWLRRSARHGVGLIGARGVAALTLPNIWSLPSGAHVRWRLEGWGDPGVMGELEALVGRWRALERRGHDRLEVTARLAGEGLRLRFSWRAGARRPASA